jgi:hypothetical protein
MRPLPHDFRAVEPPRRRLWRKTRLSRQNQVVGLFTRVRENKIGTGQMSFGHAKEGQVKSRHAKGGQVKISRLKISLAVIVSRNADPYS